LLVKYRMSLCEFCQHTVRTSCDLDDKFKTDVYLSTIQNGLALLEDPTLIPELEDRKLEQKLNKLRTQLKMTALERGCKNFG
jgi:hypothetical protein